MHILAQPLVGLFVTAFCVAVPLAAWLQDATATGTEAEVVELADETEVIMDEDVQADTPAEVAPATDTTGAASTDTQEAPTVPVVEPNAITAALANCEIDKSKLVQVLARMARSGDENENCAPLRVELENLTAKMGFCRDHVKQARRSNQSLHAELAMCTSFEDLGEDPRIDELQAEIDRLMSELVQNTEKLTSETNLRREVEARVNYLEVRLGEFGISVDPGFSYLGNNVRTSFATAAIAQRLKADVPHLDVQKCGAALDWLLEQSGPDKALRRVIWVWAGGVARLCARDRDGQIRILAPRRSDSAHIVLFQ